jgi:transcriptional regulator with XRE-family HTH domain
MPGPAATPNAAPTAEPAGDLDTVLTAIGPRLRALRLRRGLTLTQLAATTGISLSTLSRMESGNRRPTLELLLPLARAHGVALDELVGAPRTDDPRIHGRPVVEGPMTTVPLSRQPGGPSAYKHLLAPQAHPAEPDPRVHEGYEWLYVISGRLRLVLGEHDLELTAGEAAEFDCRTPHWFGAVGGAPVEFLSLFGRQGERMHVRARPRARRRDGDGDGT